MSYKLSPRVKRNLRGAMLGVMSLSLVAAVVSAALYIGLSPEVFRILHIFSTVLFAASATAVLLMDVRVAGRRRMARKRAAGRRNLYFRLR